MRFIEGKAGATRAHLSIIGAAVCTLGALGMVATQPVQAQKAWPDKPVRIVVPFGAGGSADTMARLIIPTLQEGLGQPILVEIRSGATGSIGADHVARSAPDGYTLLLTSGAFAMSPALNTKLPYDIFKDFTPIVGASNAPQVLVVHPSVPVKTVKELVAHAKANPGRLNYASSGSGANLHLSGELFKMATGTDLVHIPYKGAGPAAAAVLAGEAQLLFSSITAALPLARAGRVSALAMTSPKRSPLAPEVPTLNEQGIFNVEVPSWYTLMAPAKTPREAAERLRAEVRRVVAIAEFRETLAKQAIDVQAMPQAEFSEFLKADTAKYAAVVKKSKITAE